jgi:hypothetical protein
MPGELNKLKNKLKSRKHLKKDNQFKVIKMKAQMKRSIHRFGMEKEVQRACAIG